MTQYFNPKCYNGQIVSLCLNNDVKSEKKSDRVDSNNSQDAHVMKQEKNGEKSQNAIFW